MEEDDRAGQYQEPRKTRKGGGLGLERVHGVVIDNIKDGGERFLEYCEVGTLKVTWRLFEWLKDTTGLA